MRYKTLLIILLSFTMFIINTINTEAFSEEVMKKEIKTDEKKSDNSILDNMIIGTRFGTNIVMPSFSGAEDIRASSNNDYQASGKIFFSGTLFFEYVIHEYFSGMFEIGYTQNGWDTDTVTLMDTNLVNENDNLYVDPYDLTEKRGGIGKIRRDDITLSLLPKGRYPVDLPLEMFGKKLELIPYIATGLQFDFIVSSSYELKNYKTFDYKDNSKNLELYLPISLGSELNIGYGRILLDIRYSLSLIKNNEQIIRTYSNIEYPVDITVPKTSLNSLNISLGYSIDISTLLGFF